MAVAAKDRGRVAALIPCHDRPPAAELLAGVVRHVDELLIVDDGGPAEHAAELVRRADAAGAALLRLPENAGKGHALAAGLRYLLAREPRAASIVVLDADGQHPPEAIPELLAADGELVVGNRMGNGTMPLWRKLPNRFASRVLAALVRQPVPDSQCGMRVLRGRALGIELPGGRFESETRYLKRCLAAGIPTAWVPIPALYDHHRSAYRPLRDSLRVLGALLD